MYVKRPFWSKLKCDSGNTVKIVSTLSDGSFDSDIGPKSKKFSYNSSI